MSKRMLADVLWEAANEHLQVEGFSCFALAAAVLGRDWNWSRIRDHDAMKFLRTLGCPEYASKCAAWLWIYDEDARQVGDSAVGVRYMWLLLAMHVAEDDGIEV